MNEGKKLVMILENSDRSKAAFLESLELGHKFAGVLIVSTAKKIAEKLTDFVEKHQKQVTTDYLLDNTLSISEKSNLYYAAVKAAELTISTKADMIVYGGTPSNATQFPNRGGFVNTMHNMVAMLCGKPLFTPVINKTDTEIDNYLTSKTIDKETEKEDNKET